MQRVSSWGWIHLGASAYSFYFQTIQGIFSAPRWNGNCFIFSGVVCTTTGPEAEEHIAVDPNNASNLVEVISDFSRPYQVFYESGLRQHFLSESSDGGMTFSTATPITGVFTNVFFPSQFRKNSFPALAVNPVNGNIVDVYAAMGPRLGADVFFTQSTDGGTTFSAPVVVNDVFRGQQFFPAVAIDEAGTIHLSFFDTRNSGAAGALAYDVYATFSRDNGATFAPNARVTPTQVVMPKGIPNFIGDCSGIAAAGGFAHPVWNNGGFTNNGMLQTAKLTLP